jgi:hypothetical protein
MANKSLTDLTARTATADSDLIHVNSGGTDYKQSKSDFMHGSLARNFEVTSALTSQVDALPIDASYFGCLWNYGHVSVTGMPINALSYVKAVRANSDQFAFIEVWSALDPDGQHYIVCKNNGTWESSWTKCASKAEITSLNNSYYRCIGNVIKSKSGTAVGYGVANIIKFGKGGIIQFEAQITTAGTLANAYDVYLSRALLYAINSGIPTFTAAGSGELTFYTSSGAINTSMQGYARVMALSGVEPIAWSCSRVHNTSGSIGSWSDSAFTVGLRVKGSVPISF